MGVTKLAVKNDNTVIILVGNKASGIHFTDMLNSFANHSECYVELNQYFFVLLPKMYS